ncbi:adenosylcobalamin-dependent ribonucleoside-diphosphate reductase [candidate division WWE3 bacterium]|uniref:Vitamin B12-dependent ribonucleotide reductase n=1 Tax=candidate division WWE3 bacterium TaxID=2053526 RepID=A0A955LGW5_UNCKA|nr:adenosylcobalamin-dependent ribonucleoside-diphosphate reductase [candidate division WWE3 bacterium]
MASKDWTKIIVEKLNGTKESLDIKKIVTGIWRSAQEVGGTDESLATKLADDVLEYLNENHPRKKSFKSSEIGDAIEKVLIEKGHAKTAKAFILYRENKKHKTMDKASLGVTDDIGLSYNTLYILKRRYLKRNEKGEIIETPRQMIERIAKALSKVESTEKKQKEWYEKFLEIMINFEFLPGTRTITNAGKGRQQMANCFVWPMEDDINYIFEILHKSTLIKRNGGGCGYNFSKIRPKEDAVNGIPELAAGPVKMIEMFDLMTSIFRQEGRYESGNMAILNVNHADIFNFINAKQNDGYLSKTNISIGITDDFMEAATKGKKWDLINPRTGEVVNTVNARSILELAAQLAWATGDPGIINLSAINKGTALANPLLKERGPIEATNPCGEVPLFPYESCNLGYVNFTKFVKDDGTFDYKHLEHVMNVATRLMDNVIEASWFPVKEVTDSVRNHRRIGIGCVGWAETLVKMNVPYDSDEAFALAEKVTKTMYEAAFETSVGLADEKGSFPYVDQSIWAGKKKQPRNVALLTFPPSSGNAVICETSFGIEPLFALAYEQNVLGGMRLKSMNQMLMDRLKERGIYSDSLSQKIIENHGSIQGIQEIPKDIRDVFKVAHDIHWRDHIRMQAAFQKWTDNAITKTINMPSTTTPEDIREAYALAWELGCKGLTVYRDQTKQEQVFEFGSKDKENNS